MCLLGGRRDSMRPWQARRVLPGDGWIADMQRSSKPRRAILHQASAGRYDVPLEFGRPPCSVVVGAAPTPRATRRFLG
jgi:hypothetical protein